MLLKYLGALWKKSFLKQVLSFAYLLPVMLVIFTSLLQMVLPGYSNYQFYKRSNFTYMYSDIPLTADNPLQSINVKEGVLMPSNHMAVYSQLKEMEYEQMSFFEKNSFEDVLFATKDMNIHATYFSKDNFITKVKEFKDNTIYISYGTAKSLGVKLGDLVAVKMQDDFLDEKEIRLTVAGFIKPLNRDLILSYSTYSGFTALAIISKEDYDFILENVMRINYTFFTDKAQNASLKAYEVKKDDLVKSVEMFFDLKESKRKIVLSALSTIAAIVFLTYFEFSFARRKNRKDIETFMKLGMPAKNVRIIYFLIVYTSFAITVLLTILITKFIYLDRMVGIYCDPVVLLTFFAVLLITGSISILVQSLFIKRYCKSAIPQIIRIKGRMVSAAGEFEL